MITLDKSELKDFFGKTKIVVADPALPIGRELRYSPSPRRTLVIHFGAADTNDYITRVVSIVLSARRAWILIPRHGPASKLALSSAFLMAEALTFNEIEREQLSQYLCTRDMGPGSVSTDPYIVAGDGETIVTWDHHTHDEGLRIDLQDVSVSSTLLATLNDFGVEMEVFYSDG